MIAASEVVCRGGVRRKWIGWGTVEVFAGSSIVLLSQLYSYECHCTEHTKYIRVVEVIVSDEIGIATRRSSNKAEGANFGTAFFRVK